MHLIARDKYIIALVEDARGKQPRMWSDPYTPEQYDKHCQSCKKQITTLLEVLIHYGVLKAEDLRVPDNTPILSADCGSDGIPRWIKEKYYKKKNNHLLDTSFCSE